MFDRPASYLATTGIQGFIFGPGPHQGHQHTRASRRQYEYPYSEELWPTQLNRHRRHSLYQPAERVAADRHSLLGIASVRRSVRRNQVQEPALKTLDGPPRAAWCSLPGRMPVSAALASCRSVQLGLPSSSLLRPHRHFLSSALPGRRSSGPLSAARSVRQEIRSMWLNKALSKITGDKANTTTNGLPSGTFSDTAPSWEELHELLAAKQQELGIDPNPDNVNGPTNPHTLVRLFGSEKEPEVTLYRDHAAWCPYCQKIWLQLEEKQIPYRIEKINMRCYGDKPDSFLQMMPSGQVPVAKISGKVVGDSAAIQRALEQRFPERPLLPEAGTLERERADGLNRLERRLFSSWMQWLTSGWSHNKAKADFCMVLDVVDEQLKASKGPFFMGEEITLVDLNFTPFLERMVASLLYYKGLVIRDAGRWPGICRWFEAMESRPTYLGTRSDFYTHVHDLPPQLGGCVSHPDAEAAAAAIDGLDGKAWHLPLAPLDGASFEPYCPGENPAVDATEAAAKLIGNHSAVAKFAARGCGSRGSRPVSAPLSDPTAKPGLEHLDAVDAGLRHVAHALLVGAEAKQVSLHALQVEASSGAQGMASGPAAASAQYLRDRVGVPRDLKFPAARQLRAHLNWLIDSL